MALSVFEAKEIYTWLSVGWPTTIRPGVSEDFVKAKIREIAKDFQGYTKDEVLEGIDRWRQNNDRFPSSKNIINEIEWVRAQQRARRKTETGELDDWPMEVIYSDGSEACYGSFPRAQFVNHPRNPEHLEPEEWRRRFLARRKRIDEERGRAGHDYNHA